MEQSNSEITDTTESVFDNLADSNSDRSNVSGNKTGGPVRLSAKDTMPAPPGKKTTFEKGEEWLRSLSLENWAHIGGYVYRLYPHIIRKQVDPNASKYIDIVDKEIVDRGLRRHIITNHGGGTYNFIINDNSGKFGNRTVVEFKLEVAIDEAMPLFNLKELDWTNTKNMAFKSVLISKGMTDGEGNPIMPQGATVSQQIQDPTGTINAVSTIYDKVIDRFTKLDSVKQEMISKMILGNENKGDSNITTLLLEKMKQDDPNKSMATVTTLIAAMQAMIPKQQENGMNMATIIQMFNDNNNRTMDMFKLMIESNRTKGNDGEGKEDFFTKFLQMKQTFPEMFNGGKLPPVAERTTAEVIVDAAKEIGLPLLGLASQFIQMKGGPAPIIPVTEEQARAMASGLGQMPNAMTQPPMIPNKVLTMPQQPNSQSQQPQSQVSQIPQCPNDPSLSPIVFNFMMQYGMMIENAIKGGMDGVQVADNIKSLTPMVGQDIYTLLKAQGKDKILATMKVISVFWDKMVGAYGEDYMVQFVNDFVNAEDIMDNEDETEVPKSDV